MNKKVVILISHILLLNMMLAGCLNSLKKENSVLLKDIAEMKAQNTSLENIVKDLNEMLKVQESKSPASKETVVKENANIYRIYNLDIDTQNKEYDTCIYIPAETELKQKISILAKALSELYFNNLPIEVVKIEEVDKKKIAVINLKETQENTKINDRSKFIGDSWATKYFQGSAGGHITSTRLIETMLQREYKHGWIDGVRFLYNNETCSFEHVPELENVCFR